MYVCNRCGAKREELRVVVEPHGEVHADHICKCGGDFVEAERCKVCGEWFDNTDLFGVCECCIEEYETVGDALEYGAQKEVDIPINECIANLLSKEQIGKILTKWVEENFTDHSKPIIEYCENDKGAFSDYVKEISPK